MKQLYIGACLFLGVIAAGTTAYALEGWSVSDALYMVIITVFGIGFEEVEPVRTGALRVITILIIVAGFSSAGYFISSLIRVITEGEIGKAMKEHRKSKDIETISRHVIICGYGRIGQVLARELEAARVPFLIIDKEAERVELAHAHGWLALVGDAGDEKTLSEAHIEQAEVFAAVAPSDMANVFITLTVRNMMPNLRIIARAEDPANEKKLLQAGANQVILPAFTGGIQIAHSITRPSLGSILTDSNRYLKHDLQELGIDIVEHLIVPNGPDDRKTLKQLLHGVEAECLVLAVKRPDGSLISHPPSEHRLEAADVVLLLTHGTTFQAKHAAA